MKNHDPRSKKKRERPLPPYRAVGVPNATKGIRPVRVSSLVRVEQQGQLAEASPHLTLGRIPRQTEDCVRSPLTKPWLAASGSWLWKGGRLRARSAIHRRSRCGRPGWTPVAASDLLLWVSLRRALRSGEGGCARGCRCRCHRLRTRAIQKLRRPRPSRHRRGRWTRWPPRLRGKVAARRWPRGLTPLIRCGRRRTGRPTSRWHSGLREVRTCQVLVRVLAAPNVASSRDMVLTRQSRNMAHSCVRKK